MVPCQIELHSCVCVCAFERVQVMPLACARCIVTVNLGQLLILQHLPNAALRPLRV